MVSIFKKRNAEKELEETKVRQLKAYVSGNVIPIEEVSDPVFSQKALGGGVAIVPVENVITSPCDGVISAAMEDTKHAVGITSMDGMEILIHEGLETVSMGGSGFELYVKEGQLIKTGDKLIGFDPVKILESGCETICIMAISNQGEYSDLSFKTDMVAEQGVTVIATY